MGERVEVMPGDRVGDRASDRVSDRVGVRVGDRVGDRVVDRVVDRVGDRVGHIRYLDGNIISARPDLVQDNIYGRLDCVYYSNIVQGTIDLCHNPNPPNITHTKRPNLT